MRATGTFCLLMLSTAVWGQGPSPASMQSPDQIQGPVTTLKVTTGLVALSAVVKSKDGETKIGLTKDDFVLKQDGKEEPIRFFFQRIGPSPEPRPHGGHQRQPTNLHRR